MSYYDIHVEQLQELIHSKQPVILDMRDDAAFGSGHLSGATRADEAQIRELMRQKCEPVLVYCYHGHSSRDLATLLCRMGLSEVYNLEGGWQALQQSHCGTAGTGLAGLLETTRH